MPEFFAFTLGAEANPRLPEPDTAPLLVGRFRAVVSPLSAGPAPRLRDANLVRGQQSPPPFSRWSSSFWRRSQAWSGRSPRAFAPAGGGRRGEGSDGMRAGSSTDFGSGQHLDGSGLSLGHGFYNNTGYGTIITGYYTESSDDEDEGVGGGDNDENGSQGFVGDDVDDVDDVDDRDDEDEPDLTATGGSINEVQKGREGEAVRSPIPLPELSRWSWIWWSSREKAPAVAASYRPLHQDSYAVGTGFNSRDGRLGALSNHSARAWIRHRPRQRRRFGMRSPACFVRRTIRRTLRHLRNLWLTPKRATVRRAVVHWWWRWTLLVVVPAAVAVAWCALPFPQYPLEDDDDDGSIDFTLRGRPHRPPGHGEARVQISFWFFLLVYYGPYNFTALIWITKVFNLYGLNWWPPALGFTPSMVLLAAGGLVIPAAVFAAAPSLRPIWADHNTAWVTWTFGVMAMPVGAALLLLLRHERLRAQQHAWSSDSMRGLFSAEPETVPPPSWQRTRVLGGRGWHRSRMAGGNVRGYGSILPRADFLAASANTATNAAEADARALFSAEQQQRLKSRSTSSSPSPVSVQPRASAPPAIDAADNTSLLLSTVATPPSVSTSVPVTVNEHWLPASFVRFLWLTSALFTSLLVYELGEASASLFLAALPDMQHHATVYAVAYVYGWALTVFLLDALTGWILGGRPGERVGSYPLGWVFKLYFMLTYQTYLRALYVRLRAPSQFVYLQVLSSTTLVLVTPLLMARGTHRLLAALGLNGQTYAAYQKVCVRNVFVRFVAQNTTMLAFLGSLFVLHFGPNRAVYPYFAFDADGGDGGDRSGPGGITRSAGNEDNGGYTFSFTLYASSITWACELVAAVVVSALIRGIYGMQVVAEGTMDLVVWPELLPTSVAVAVHVLQNMLFSIIRLRFW
ncbi:hypothetical protein SPI_08319 [Niveomyces insectorum RCEF 264]|uniref:Uncharacterized protein n=1 Tax=Niveomyces insectorum RCEF 264 TaxID=1081102 RepID=A0A167N7L7_9HYPO|nr:hypothetical protein SPI_08319 [Niveomyces insectorum RCEF 264]